MAQIKATGRTNKRGHGEVASSALSSGSFPRARTRSVKAGDTDDSDDFTFQPPPRKKLETRLPPDSTGAVATPVSSTTVAASAPGSQPSKPRRATITVTAPPCSLLPSPSDDGTSLKSGPPMNGRRAQKHRRRLGTAGSSPGTEVYLEAPASPGTGDLPVMVGESESRLETPPPGATFTVECGFGGSDNGDGDTDEDTVKLLVPRSRQRIQTPVPAAHEVVAAAAPAHDPGEAPVLLPSHRRPLPASPQLLEPSPRWSAVDGRSAVEHPKQPQQPMPPRPRGATADMADPRRPISNASTGEPLSNAAGRSHRTHERERDGAAFRDPPRLKDPPIITPRLKAKTAPRASAPRRRPVAVTKKRAGAKTASHLTSKPKLSLTLVSGESRREAVTPLADRRSKRSLPQKLKQLPQVRRPAPPPPAPPPPVQLLLHPSVGQGDTSRAVQAGAAAPAASATAPATVLGTVPAAAPAASATVPAVTPAAPAAAPAAVPAAVSAAAPAATPVTSASVSASVLAAVPAVLPAAASVSLTDSQRARVEQSRQAALAKQRQRQQVRAGRNHHSLHIRRTLNAFV